MTSIVMAILSAIGTVGILAWLGKHDERESLSREEAADRPILAWAVRHMTALKRSVGVTGFLLTVFFVAKTSIVIVGPNETGHITKIYGASSLKDGRIIAANGEMGKQARILSPGFHFSPFLTVINNIRMAPVIQVPPGQIAVLVARDGDSLKPGEAYSDAFAPAEKKRMIEDAKYFLENGGQKGPQTTVLSPGEYRLNLHLWDYRLMKATVIPEGHVGVVKSNVHSRVDFGDLMQAEKPESFESLTPRDVEGQVSTPIVRVGAIGVWEEPVGPGTYYLNPLAYEVNIIPTKAKTWTYKGGYTKREVELTLDQDGQIQQNETRVSIPVPEDAADDAITVKVEGWNVPLELRALVQVAPKDAPFVVASVGDLQAIEDRILTPTIRSVVRDVTGGGVIEVPDLGGETVRRKVKVLDLIENRKPLQDAVEKAIVPEGLKAGVRILEVRFGEPAIPPEVLLPSRRKQLASNLADSYRQEKLAQDQRIAAEQARETAEQQPQLVKAQIEVQRAEQLARAREFEGQGEKARLELIAKGQRAQAQVLGEARTYQLELVKQLLSYAGDNPEVLTQALSNPQKFVPNTVFQSGTEGSSDMSFALGVLGQMVGTPKGQGK